MANFLISSSNVQPPAARYVVDTKPDNRVWLYKGQEARLFPSKDAVPQDEDWREAPYEPDAKPALDKPQRKKSKADIQDANGNSN